ncbi:MAG: hypothetical protein AB7O24_03520 [Kofleriaceae bacterium]
MVRGISPAVVLAVVAGCPASSGEQGSGAEIETPIAARGSGDSFSAKLAADLTPMGYVPSPPTAPSAPVAGSASGSGDTAGSAPTAGSAGPPLTPAMPAPTAGSAGPAPPPPPPTPGSAAPSAMVPPAAGSAAPVRTSAEVAAIKLSMLPNWRRDSQAAGTISLSVDGATTFTFNYGYDDPRAPADREQYKSYLTSSKLLTVTTERQRGSAMYYEGTDREGRAAFRFLVIYGGKRLVCYGPLYKDAAHSAYSDIRDQVVIQAKQICETLQL